MRIRSRHGLGLLLAAALPVPAGAQVVLDGTLGSAGAGVVAAGFDDQGQSASYLIHDGLGERVGENLFHSFSRFDVGVGETATFTSGAPTPPQNVLARVTGGSESRILGTLRSTIPGADLWLINPAGWLFGQGSSLDVAGSLHVSSGEYVRHADATRFGVGLDPVPALSVAPAEAFGFLDSEVGELRVEATRLDLPTGETLSLVGGDVGIRGSRTPPPVVWSQSQTSDVLSLPSGRLNLVAVASPGEVVLDDSRLDPQLDVGSFAQLGRIEVSDGARIVYAGAPGGTAVIRADSLLLDRSILDGTTVGDSDHPGVSADLGVRGAISFYGQNILWPTLTRALNRPAQLLSTTTGAGDGGSIRVRADVLHIEHDGTGAPGNICFRTCTGPLSVSTGGEPGDIDVDVRQLTASGYHAGIGVQRVAPSLAHGGMIRILADEIDLDDSTISTNSHYAGTAAVPLYAEADAGDISIRTGRLTMTGVFGIFANTYGSGRAGNIHLVADEIEMSASRPWGTITSITNGTGRGGQIAIEGRDMIMDGFVVVTAAAWDPVWYRVPTPDANPTAGDAGSILIQLDNLYMRNGAALSSSTLSGGAGGDIEIHVRNLLRLEGTGEDVAPRGRISGISTLSTRLEDTARVTPGDWEHPPYHRTAGDAGNIEIEAEEVQIDGGWIASSTMSEGAAGDVTIRANRLTAASSPGNNPFAIESETFRAPKERRDENAEVGFVQGPAGHVTLIGTGTDSLLRVEGIAMISARTETPASGGDLFVDFDHVVLDGGTLTVGSALVEPEKFSVGSVAEEAVKGRAGDLTLFADTLRMEDGGQIVARSTRADGGNIAIHAANAVELFDSSITAEVGIEAGSEATGGNISIDPEWVILDDGSVISADAHAGDGGSISIRTQGLFVSPDSRISASSQYGLSGTVTLDAPESNLSGELASLSQTYLDAASQIGGRCSHGGRLAMDKGLAIAPAPDGALPSSLVEPLAGGLAQVR